MYTQINSEKIKLDFNSGIECTIDGPDSYYYVQVSEFVQGNDTPIYVEGYNLPDINFKKNTFLLPIKFFIDFEISIFKFVDKVGLVNIFNHRFNDYGQYVKFVIDTKNFDEAKIWFQKVIEYQKRRGCKILFESPFQELNKNFETHFNVKNIDPYKTYKIGRYPKSSNDFRTLDERCEGLIWFGCWKKFWSYEHPRNWSQINSTEIANDILGL